MNASRRHCNRCRRRNCYQIIPFDPIRSLVTSSRRTVAHPPRIITKIRHFVLVTLPAWKTHRPYSSSTWCCWLTRQHTVLQHCHLMASDSCDVPSNTCSADAGFVPVSGWNAACFPPVCFFASSAFFFVCLMLLFISHCPPLPCLFLLSAFLCFFLCCFPREEGEEEGAHQFCCAASGCSSPSSRWAEVWLTIRLTSPLTCEQTVTVYAAQWRPHCVPKKNKLFKRFWKKQTKQMHGVCRSLDYSIKMVHFNLLVVFSLYSLLFVTSLAAMSSCRTASPSSRYCLSLILVLDPCQFQMCKSLYSPVHNHNAVSEKPASHVMWRHWSYAVHLMLTLIRLFLGIGWLSPCLLSCLFMTLKRFSLVDLILNKIKIAGNVWRWVKRCCNLLCCLHTLSHPNLSVHPND